MDFVSPQVVLVEPELDVLAVLVFEYLLGLMLSFYLVLRLLHNVVVHLIEVHVLPLQLPVLVRVFFLEKLLIELLEMLIFLHQDFHLEVLEVLLGLLLLHLFHLLQQLRHVGSLLVVLQGRLELHFLHHCVEGQDIPLSELRLFRIAVFVEVGHGCLLDELDLHFAGV